MTATSRYITPREVELLAVNRRDMMTKRQLAMRLAILCSNGSDEEESRIFAHAMKRTEAELKVSVARWTAINSVTQAEIDRHCDLSGLI